MKMIGYSRTDKSVVVTVEHRPLWRQLLRLPSVRRSYFGMGTVWRSYPCGERCDTELEYALADMVALHEHEIELVQQ